MMAFCYSCGGPTDRPETGGVTICANCRQAQIASIVPPEFMATDPSRLHQAKLKEVLEWVPGAKGLVIAGDAGVGKTRCMWELLKRHIRPGDFVFMPGPGSFGNQLVMRYRDESAESWLQEVGDAPIVAIDDITKLKMTERVEAELFGLIDYRCNHHRPIIVTMQGNRLSDRFSSDRGQPMVRRLREFCRVVDFSE